VEPDRLSTEDYLRQLGIDKGSISEVSEQATSEIEPITNTDEYLLDVAKRNNPSGIPKAQLEIQTKIRDLTTEEGRKAAEMEQRLAEMEQRLGFRKIILFSQLLPMCLIPCWLVMVLSLPIFSIKAYSEDMQKGFLIALGTDALGICFIVARDLFPLAKEEKKNSTTKND
jgi:hypothetical protein